MVWCGVGCLLYTRPVEPDPSTPRLDHGQHIYGLFVAVRTLTGLERAVAVVWCGGRDVVIQNIS